MRTIVTLVAAVVVALGAAGCGDDSGGATTTLEEQRQRMSEETAEQQELEEEGDASAQLACDHFRNVAGDASQGILSDDELREKLREVDDDAQVSEVDGVRTAARAMLRAATQGDDVALADAVEGMDAACDDIGH